MLAYWVAYDPIMTWFWAFVNSYCLDKQPFL